VTWAADLGIKSGAGSAKRRRKFVMALVACKECGKEISKKAASCPHCGFKPKRTSTFTWIVTIFVAVPMLIAIFSGASNTSSETQQTTKTPEQMALEKKRDAAVQRATVGATTLKLWNKECGGKSGQDVATAIRWLAL
jgi:hypothetical protein